MGCFNSAVFRVGFIPGVMHTEGTGQQREEEQEKVDRATGRSNTRR